MKIAITGALGHIGSQIIHKVKPGDFTEVVLIDNLLTQRYCSLYNLPEDVPFQFVEEDICTTNLEKLFKGIDVVIHLAAITDAANSFKNADNIEIVNFEGTERVARACASVGAKLVFFSTTSVYGTQEKLVDENCSQDELKPQSPYASSKLKGEQLLHKISEREGLQYIIFRFGTIFGTSIGMRFHTAINKFCWQASVGKPITVWRTALNQKRPYLGLDDAVRAINFIINNNHFNNEIYNVLSANSTVAEIVDQIKILVPDARIEYVDERIMNQLSYEVSNEKFKNLGFQFQNNIPSGISETIKLIKGVRQLTKPEKVSD